MNATIRRRKRRRRLADLETVGWSAWWSLIEGKRPHRQSREPLRRVWRMIHDDVAPCLYTHGMTADGPW